MPKVAPEGAGSRYGRASPGERLLTSLLHSAAIPQRSFPASRAVAVCINLYYQQLGEETAVHTTTSDSLNSSGGLVESGSQTVKSVFFSGGNSFISSILNWWRVEWFTSRQK